MNDTNDFSADQIAEKVIASSLTEALRVYLALLEDGTNKAAFKECGTTVRVLAECLSNCTSDTFVENDDDDDPDGEEADDMERFYNDDD